MLKDFPKKPLSSKIASPYPINKSKPLAFTSWPDKYPHNGYESRNSFTGYSSSAIYRESGTKMNQFSIKFDENAPTNEARAYDWAVALKNEKLISRLVTDDKEIENVVLDLPNQRVVKNDCMRTRVGIFDDNMRDNLEKLLTFYCKRENITYKQGLNEVAAPFVYFRKSQVSIANIYNYFVLFIDRFLPTAFIDKDFLTLQCYFRTLELLLRYHDPKFHTFLTINDLPSELYATPWFLTLFASKMSLDMVYFLWDISILENDTCFKFFIGLALLLENKNSIIGSETSMIPQSISNLTIQNSSQMKQIYKRAVELRMKTPASFLTKIRELDIFKKDYQSTNELKSRMEKNVEYLESLQCVLVSAHEITNALYKDDIACSDPQCINYRKPEDDERSSPSLYNRAGSFDAFKRDKERRLKKAMSAKESSNFTLSNITHKKNILSKEFSLQCALCQEESANDSISSNLSAMPHLRDLINYKHVLKLQSELEPTKDFLIIDLRQNKSCGALPKSHQVEFNKLLDETINLLINDFIEYQSNYHFVFMTSNFNSWIFKDLVDSKNIKTKRSSKEMLKSDRPGLKGGSVSIEDEWLMAFLNAFVQNGFPYLSILEGGFNEINRDIHGLNLSIINHNPDHCSACKGESNSKGPSFFNLINKVIDKTGEKLGMLVDGIHNNASYSDTSRMKYRGETDRGSETPVSRTSQAFSTFKKYDEIKIPLMSQDRSRPQPSTSTGPTPSHIVSESAQETGDYFAASSVYGSDAGSGPGAESMSNGFSKYLKSGYNNINHDESPSKSRINGFDSPEAKHSGRVGSPSKIDLSSSNYIVNHQSTLQPKAIHPSGSQSPFMKSTSAIYGIQSLLEPRSELIGRSTYGANQGPTIAMLTSPKVASPEPVRIGSSQDFEMSPTGHLSSALSPHAYSRTDALNASKHVFEPQKDKEDSTAEDFKMRKQSNSQEKRNVNNTSLHMSSKAKSNDKVINYGNYAAPTLAKLFKPVRPGEDDSKTKFYTDFSVIKPFDGDTKQKNEKSYKDISLADSFHVDPLHDARANKSVYTYNNISTPKVFLESYSKPMNPTSSSSASKKGTFTQILKETTVSMAQRVEVGPEGYQPFTKQDILPYTTIPSTDVPRDYEDRSRRVSGKQERPLHLDNLVSDSLSTREITSLRTITQSPSPKREREGKMSERFEPQKKDMMIDTTLVYSGYTDMTSPIQADLLRNALNRVEEGKVTSRAQSTPESSYYERNGIFKEFKLSQNGVYWLYKAFEGVEFSLYASDYVKDSYKDDISASTMTSSTDSTNKRILMISKEFLVGIQYNAEIMEDLRLLQVGVSADKILKRNREKSFGKGFQSPHDTFDNGLLSPKDYFRDNLVYKNCEVVVQALFPVKLLLRITSKKADAKFLSFYFKLPTIERVLSLNASKFFNFSESSIQELPNLLKKEEYLRILREISDIKESPTVIQSKSVYCFDSAMDAQECIQKTKEAYSFASSYLHEKLRKNTRT